VGSIVGCMATVLIVEDDAVMDGMARHHDAA
jgi:hypothetical protein